MSKKKKIILTALIIFGIAVIIAGIFCFKGIIHKNSVGELKFFYTDRFNYNYFEESFDPYTGNFEKKSDKIISEEKLKNTVYKHCNDIIKMGNDSKRYEIDHTVYVFLNREKGVFIVNLGVYTKRGELISHERNNRIYIDASNGEILGYIGPELVINDYPIYMTDNYENMTELKIDEETAKILEKIKGKYKEKYVAFKTDEENSSFEEGKEITISETKVDFDGREYYAGHTFEYTPAKFYELYRLDYEDVKLFFDGNKIIYSLSAKNSLDENVLLFICGEDVYILQNEEFIKLEKM
ncbi:MAG: hypothetical protein J6A69_03485 [Clostridia bacterium]|nr:hypothetical protein [Clostridia bacterium]